MADPQKVSEDEVPDLPEGLGSVDEIHLPGDDEKRQAAMAAMGEDEPAAAQETSAAEQQAEVGDEGEEAPRRRLDLLRERYSPEAGEGEEAAPAKPDPRDTELAEARRRIDALYEARIQELKERQAQGAAAPETAPADPRQARAERLKEARELLAERWAREDLTVEEQTADLIATMDELLEMEREQWETTALAPIKERFEAEDRARAVEQHVSGIAHEVLTGIDALRKAGGTRAELADEFLDGMRRNNLENSYLAHALFAGWDRKKQALPPNLGSRQTVEAMGIALAAEVDRMLEEGGGSNGRVGPGAPAPAGPSGLVPKKRSSKPDTKTTGEEAVAEQLLDETTAHMGDAFHLLGLDKAFADSG